MNDDLVPAALAAIDNNRKFIDLGEYCTRRGVSYTTAVRDARAGRIPAIQQGRKWAIPASYLDRLEADAYERMKVAQADPNDLDPMAAVAAARAAVRRHVGGDAA